jgi:hypothetical protein
MKLTERTSVVAYFRANAMNLQNQQCKIRYQNQRIKISMETAEANPACAGLSVTNSRDSRTGVENQAKKDTI